MEHLLWLMSVVLVVSSVVHLISTQLMNKMGEALKAKDQRIPKKIAFHIDVGRCARCGQDHKLPFHRFENPPEYCTHWAICPNTFEPVLLRIEPTEGERE